MEFRKSYINDLSLSRYERNLYWISLPFDVKLSDVFGFGKYGQHWIIEEYDGKGRAQNGYWVDSKPNWKYVTEEVKDEYIATFDATVSGTMPTAVKDGRHFAGWYTAAGTSYQVIDANGTWKQVTGYTDASKHWIRASNTTLYAHYDDPTFLSIDFSPEHAMPQADITATISFNPAIGDPEGDYTLCYTLGFVGSLNSESADLQRAIYKVLYPNMVNMSERTM